MRRDIQAMAWFDKSKAGAIPSNGHFQPQAPEMGLIRAAVRNTQMSAATSEQILEFKGGKGPWGPAEFRNQQQFDGSPPRGELYNHMNKGREREGIASNFREDTSKVGGGFSPPSYAVGAPVQKGASQAQWSKGKEEETEKRAYEYAPSSPTKVQQRTESNKGKEMEKFQTSYLGKSSTISRTDPVPYETPRSDWRKGNENYAPPPSKLEVQQQQQAPGFRKSIDNSQGQGYARGNNYGSEHLQLSYNGRHITFRRTDPAPYETPRTEWHKETGNYSSLPYPAAHQKIDEYSEKNKAKLHYNPSSSPTKAQVSPRKGPAFQNISGREEASWWYSTRANPPEKTYKEDDDDNEKIIDCIEAAIKYNGVLV